MNRRKLRYFSSLTIILIFSVILTACGSNKAGTNQSATDGDNLGKKDLTIPYVAWATEVASNHVIKEVLNSVGYDVTLKQVDTGPMYIAVANGAADAMISAWLPYTDVSYWDQYGEKLVDLGPNLKNAPLGLVVPEYVDIDSIEDLKKNTNSIGENTEWTITGIDPGAGQMQITEEAMDIYGLDKWNLQATSDASMMAALDKAIKEKQNIIVTLWSPHWAFTKYDLKYLEDPRQVFGEPDDIHTLVRKGLEEDSPAAYRILKQFKWNKDLLEGVMVDINNGTDPADAAKKFVKENEDLVKEWTEGVK
ncbi:glycine betaine ABC transporter substrate-binding protein [Cytobacillus citreus]|uniref:glycine betaine ABC transporter substrate-binding protein n=1 Tax=Cytobacillus citreus TaxID=2833586 RepID=UPI0030842A09